jgi:hypothetical protein
LLSFWKEQEGAEHVRLEPVAIVHPNGNGYLHWARDGKTLCTWQKGWTPWSPIPDGVPVDWWAKHHGYCHECRSKLVFFIVDVYGDLYEAAS